MGVIQDNGSTTGRPTFTMATGVGEQTVFTSTRSETRWVMVKLDVTTLTQSNSLRLYSRVDGSNYILQTLIAWTTAATDVQTFGPFITSDAFRVTMQAGVDETATRAIPYRVEECPIP